MYPVLRRGEPLELRELQPTDTDAVFAIYGSELATTHLSFEPRTRDEVRDLLSRARTSAHTEPRTESVLAITDATTLIGVGRLATDPHQPRAATLGFTLNPTSWGTDLGTETARFLRASPSRTHDR